MRIIKPLKFASHNILTSMNQVKVSVFVIALALIVANCATTTSETAVITEISAPIVEVVEEDLAQVEEPDNSVSMLDTVTVGRFDYGKMWTFDNPPLEYFKQEYGLELSGQWFDLASRGALRFGTSCSASFVSPHGLVMTNHHCARESILKVSRVGEALVDQGFYAEELEGERKVADLYVDQLVAIEDVTKRVRSSVPDYQNDEEEAEARKESIEAIEKSMTNKLRDRDTTLQVEIVSLYRGGKFSAYTFKRYHDVRLVIAPELKVAKFGGESDNFTYPRYSLDMAFFRVYDHEGNPLDSEYFFPWSTNGVNPGDPVFVVGNPGSTSRLQTISQLEYERDYALPQQIETLKTRARILKSFIDSYPDSAYIDEVRNTYFTLMNLIKANEGQLRGLQDPYLMARKQAAESSLEAMINEKKELSEEYGTILTNIEAVQRSKRATADQSGALNYFGSSTIGSRILTRGLYGYVYSLYKQRGAPTDRLLELKEESAKIKDFPKELEKALIAARIDDLVRYLGQADPSVKGLLKGRSSLDIANELTDSTALIDSTGFFNALDQGYLTSKDASVPVIQVLAPLYFTLGQQNGSFADREDNLSEKLALARLELFGTSIPPDATFSLRLSDGVVKGYSYNGTEAPYKTTFFGLYDHYHTYGPRSEWDLPDRWLSPPANFDLSTPYNLISTNDITGGNSGSPLLNANLEIVGLIFDGNIESLPNQYMYSDVTARAISVDARAMLEVLDDMYDADRLVLELTRGTIVSTEAEADAVLSGE